MSQQDIWELWAAIDELKTERTKQVERIAKLTKSLARLRASIKRAKAQERAICDKAEQTVREEAATLIQVLDDACRAKIDELAAQGSRLDTRADTRDDFEDEVRQLLGLGPREAWPAHG